MTEVGQTILIVEDEPLIAMLLADMLEDAGFATALAASADEAFGWLEASGRPDLIISDQSMPNMTGSDMAAAVIAKFGPVPVLIASGHTHGPDFPYPTLRKPFAEADVLDAVARLIAPR